MKRFFASKATTLFVTLLIAAAFIAIVPDWREQFSIFWDTNLLPRYKARQLYERRWIFLAIFSFVAGYYLFSRDYFWRYASNQATLKLQEGLLELPLVERLYYQSRNTLVLAGYTLYWRLLNAVPARFRSSEANELIERGLTPFLPANRRVLAMLRSRLDLAIQLWQTQLLSIQFAEDVEARAAAAEMLNDRWPAYIERRLKHDSVLWQTQFGAFSSLASLPATQLEAEIHPIEVELLGGLILIYQEQLSAALYEERLAIGQGRANGVRIALSDRLLVLFDKLNGEQREVSVGALLKQHLTLVVDRPIEALPIYMQLLQLVPMLPAVSRVWAAAIMQQQMILHVTQLIAQGYAQEAIQVRYEFDAALTPFLQPPTEALNYEDESEGWLRYRRQLAKLLETKDVETAKPFWGVVLAAPRDERWSDALLAEAWTMLQTSLSSALVWNGEWQSNGIVSADLLKQHYAGIRQGYLDYTERTASGLRIATNHPNLSNQSTKYTVPTDENVRHRTHLIGQIWRVPQHFEDAARVLSQPHGWQRLMHDGWRRLLTTTVAGGSVMARFCSLAVCNCSIRCPHKPPSLPICG